MLRKVHSYKIDEFIRCPISPVERSKLTEFFPKLLDLGQLGNIEICRRDRRLLEVEHYSDLASCLLKSCVRLFKFLLSARSCIFCRCSKTDPEQPDENVISIADLFFNNCLSVATDTRVRMSFPFH